MTHQHPRSALTAMLVGAVFISTTSLFIKWAHVAPTVSAFYRMLFGGGMLLILLIATRQWQKIAARDIGWMLAPALAFAIDLILWHRSIRDVGPGLATLLGNFQVFIMALAGVLFYRERLSVRFLLGLLLAFVGLWLLVGRSWVHLDMQYRLGVWFGLLTAVAYAAFMLSFRHAQSVKLKLDAAQLLCVSSLLCAGILGLVVYLEGESFLIPNLQTWTALVGVGLFGQVLGGVLIMRAMPQLPVSLIGLLLLLQPSLSFIFDVILFARPTQWLDWLGIAISLMGIFYASVKPASKIYRSEST